MRLRAAQRLNQTIFLALMALSALVSVPFGTVEPWWVALFECVIFLLGALWIIEGLLEGTWHWSGDARHLLVPLVSILLFAFIQTLPLWSARANDLGSGVGFALSADPYQTRLWILHVGALILAGALLMHYTSDLKRLRFLIHLIIAIGMASAVFGIVRHAGNFPLPATASVSFSTDAGYGQFINRNHFALLMEMTLGLTLGMMTSGSVHRYYLPLYLAAASLIWVALVLTTSRGGILSMIGQFLFLAFLWNHSRPAARKGIDAKQTSVWFRRIGGTRLARLMFTLGLVGIMTVGVIWVGGDALVDRLKSTPRELTLSNDSRENINRLSIWKTTLLMIKDHPITGVGFGGYSKAVTEYHDASGRWTPQEAHNDYLELIASGGIIGVLLVGWLFILFVKRAKQRFKLAPDSFRHAASLGALVGLSGVAFHSLVDFGLHITINALVCVALIVIATKHIRTANVAAIRS